jgi:glycosyltransferase involved in cell wall biosynthesis
MIRVAISIGTLEVGGAENFVVNLLKNLDYSRFSLLLIVLEKPCDSFLEKEVEKLPIQISYMKKKEGFSIKVIIKVFKTLRKFKPDILHGNIGGLIYFLPFLVLKKIKMIYTAHTLADKEFGILKQRILKRFLRRKKIIAVGISPEIKKSLEKVYEINSEDIPLIYNGIDVEKFSFNRCYLENIVIGHVGRFEPVKNHRTIIEVYQLLKNKYPKISLRLVGDGSLFLKYKEELKNDLSVVFVGESMNVSEELKKIDLFLMPSLYEGLPLSVLEAMASGCVIVASCVGGLKDLIEDEKNGYLINDSRDVEGFFEVIENLVNDRKKLRDISLNNIRKVHNFDIKNTVKEYQELYCMEARHVKRGI